MSFSKYSDGFFFFSRRNVYKGLRECDYKDNTRIILNKLFSCEIMSEINLKGNGKKIGITNTEILNVTLGKLFVYLKIRMKILFVTPLETM